MLGYITVNRDELKVKDLDTYQAFYCGICKDIKKNSGEISRFTLTYDMTFLSILLTSLYDGDTKKKKLKCVFHPISKKLSIQNKFTSYCADMNVLLTYHNLMDDWIDDKKKRSLMYAGLIKKSFKKLEKKYQRQSKAISDYLVQLHKVEASDDYSIDLASGLTGRMLEQIFKIYDDDIWNRELSAIGFYIGKFIYLMDAYEDIEKDIKTGNYNPFKVLHEQKDFRDRAREILTMMMAPASAAFERLPIVDFVDILRNILYSGVWIKFNELDKQEKKKDNAGSV